MLEPSPQFIRRERADCGREKIANGRTVGMQEVFRRAVVAEIAAVVAAHQQLESGAMPAFQQEALQTAVSRRAGRKKAGRTGSQDD